MTDDGSLLEEMVAVVMGAVGDAFAELWQRPDARQHLEDWLDGRAVFVVGRDGLEVRRRTDTHGSDN